MSRSASDARTNVQTFRHGAVVRWLGSRAGWAVGVAVFVLGCGAKVRREPGAERPPNASAEQEQGAVREPLLLLCHVRLSADGASLCVNADFPEGVPREWSVDPPAEPFRGSPVARPAGSPLEGPCFANAPRVADRSNVEPQAFETRRLEGACRSGCRFAYRFLLRQAADELSDRRFAVRSGPSIVAPASTWLLRPRKAPSGTRYRFSVETTGDSKFVTGTSRAPGHLRHYEALLPDGYFAPYSVFGPLRLLERDIWGAELTLALLSPSPLPNEQAYVDWIFESAWVVGNYLQRFPADRAAVLLRPEPHFGTQMGIGGASVLLGMDAGAQPEQGKRDWVAAHEMMHIAFVATARRHRWASEGLATYAESVARVRAGQITAQEMWSLFHERFPLGQPGPLDEGLNQTRTWANTYWGGALFWFVADVTALRATGGQRGLSQVLAGLVERGANSTVYWPLRRVMREADEILGVPIFVELYEQYALSPRRTDLQEVWEFLGVVESSPAIRLSDTAQGSAIRWAIEGRSG